MPLPIVTTDYFDNGGGVDYSTSTTKIPDHKKSYSLNVKNDVDGSTSSRYGSTILNVSAGIPAQMSGAPTTTGLFEFKKNDDTIVQIISAGSTIKHSLTTPTNQVTGLSASNLIPTIHQTATASEEWAIFCNGSDTNLKYNSATPAWVNLSLPRPSAPTLTDFAVGTLAAGSYYYYYSHARVSGSIILEEGELSPISTVLTIAANRTIRVTIGTSSDSQVNARIIYRISPSSSGVAYRHKIISDNTTTTFDDDGTTAQGTTEAEYNNQAAPNAYTAITNDFGETFYATGNNVYVSKPYKPSNVPTENVCYFDSKVTCLYRIYGMIVIGTLNSIWYIQGEYFDGARPSRAANIGLLNKRSAAGIDTLYVLATNFQVYSLTATDLISANLKIENPITREVSTLIAQSDKSNTEMLFLHYYSDQDISKLYFSISLQGTYNDTLLVFNELISKSRNEIVWEVFDNIYSNAMGIFKIDDELALCSGDYNGFLWKIEDSSTYGDGSEENGTITSSTLTTLTDSTQSWAINEHVGKRFYIVTGTGSGQSRVITANTATQLTFGSLSTALSTDSEYSIGGYKQKFFTNWRPIQGSRDDLKRLLYVVSNLNTTGTYSVKLIVQYDNITDETSQYEYDLTLTSGAAIWGEFTWGDSSWGTRSVISKIIKPMKKYKTVRFGIESGFAGQPFSLNYFTSATQNLGQIFNTVDL
jgi:hypothetical protein